MVHNKTFCFCTVRPAVLGTLALARLLSLVELCRNSFGRLARKSDVCILLDALCLPFSYYSINPSFIGLNCAAQLASRHKLPRNSLAEKIVWGNEIKDTVVPIIMKWCVIAATLFPSSDSPNKCVAVSGLRLKQQQRWHAVDGTLWSMRRK